jgi:hypothetical protein
LNGIALNELIDLAVLAQDRESLNALLPHLPVALLQRAYSYLQETPVRFPCKGLQSELLYQKQIGHNSGRNLQLNAHFAMIEDKVYRVPDLQELPHRLEFGTLQGNTWLGFRREGWELQDIDLLRNQVGRRMIVDGYYPQALFHSDLLAMRDDENTFLYDLTSREKRWTVAGIWFPIQFLPSYGALLISGYRANYSMVVSLHDGSEIARLPPNVTAAQLQGDRLLLSFRGEKQAVLWGIFDGNDWQPSCQGESPAGTGNDGSELCWIDEETIFCNNRYWSVPEGQPMEEFGPQFVGQACPSCLGTWLRWLRGKGLHKTFCAMGDGAWLPALSRLVPQGHLDHMRRFDQAYGMQAKLFPVGEGALMAIHAEAKLQLLWIEPVYVELPRLPAPTLSVEQITTKLLQTVEPALHDVGWLYAHNDPELLATLRALDCRPSRDLSAWNAYLDLPGTLARQG